MLMFLYAIYDIKASCFNAPFAQKTNAEAMRTFGDLVVDKTSRISSHPEDYELHLVGQFDSEGGNLLAADVQRLAGGRDFKEGREMTESVND